MAARGGESVEIILAIYQVGRRLSKVVELLLIED